MSGGDPPSQDFGGQSARGDSEDPRRECRPGHCPPWRHSRWPWVKDTATAVGISRMTAEHAEPNDGDGRDPRDHCATPFRLWRTVSNPAPCTGSYSAFLLADHRKFDG